MKTRIVFSGALLILLLFAIAVPVRAQSPSPQQALDQYVADLQKNPNDSALREKIIKLAREMNPPPAIPEEARRHYVKACTLFDDAKQPSDSADAADEFRQALLVAPWWGDAYMKMGMALETAQRYDDAIASLKLFMATNPQDEVLRKTQDEIYKIEAKAQKAAKDKELAAKKAVEDRRAQQENAEAKKAKEQEEFLKNINGARYMWYWNDEWNAGYQALDVLGDTVTERQCYSRVHDRSVRVGVEMETGVAFKIQGRTLRAFVSGGPISGLTGVISDDGRTITLTFSPEHFVIYKRER